MGIALATVALMGFLALPTGTIAQEAPSTHVEAASPAGAGFIYGTVTTTNGQTFTGFLRWDDEEAFWGDLFNSRRTTTPHLESRGGSSSKREYEIFGRKISFGWGGSDEKRGFVVRFGDIDRIEVLEDDEAKLTMKGGEVLEVEGASNDVNADVTIHDPGFGAAEVPWSRIRTIDFSDAPTNAEPLGSRLVGTVETEAGTFNGPIQWDKQEGVSLDRLDGDDGDIEMSLIMGNIQSVSRVGSEASKVVLRDGRELELDDSNDVDDDNRGLLVEDQRFGKVEIPWMSFERVTFLNARSDPEYSSGPSFMAFAPQGLLTGTATTHDGQRLTGHIVYDLHKENDWELFTGKQGELTYFVPFGLISAIEPREESVEVTLNTGESLTLSETRDTGESNAGVLILRGDAETFVAWSDLRRLTID